MQLNRLRISQSEDIQVNACRGAASATFHGGCILSNASRKNINSDVSALRCVSGRYHGRYHGRYVSMNIELILNQLHHLRI